MVKSVPLTCVRCGEQFFRFHSRAKRYARQFCSAACSLADKKADRAGCISKATGYRQLSIECRTVLEHRLIMERHLGRALGAEEVVHHINGNRSDNRIENLRVIENSAAHMREHGNERWSTAEAAFLNRRGGLTFRQIGEVLGANGQAVWLRLYKNGLTVPLSRKGVPRDRRKTDEEIAALRAEFAALA